MAENPRIDNRGKLVCVTGASGFIGSHVVRELLERGYRVRATVRDAKNDQKTAHLKEIAEGSEHPLELFSADLLTEGSFDEAFAGCDFVCHVAASVMLNAKDPQKEIVDPTVQGTLNALRSAARTDSIKRFVLTSSVAAIFNIKGKNNDPNYTYTEKDWCEDATLETSPYPLSKTISEKTAWEFVESESPGFDLIAIQPGYVTGPVYTKAHIRSSPTLMRDLIVGTFPLNPQFNFCVVDVRDVADAHINALEFTNAKGRYMLTHVNMWVYEMSAALRKAYPHNKKIPKRIMPNWIMYAVSLFDKRLNFDFLRRNLGKQTRFDANKSIEELEIAYRDSDQSIVDTCQSMIERNLL